MKPIPQLAEYDQQRFSPPDAVTESRSNCSSQLRVGPRRDLGLKQNLNAAEQELAEYAILMQAREQEVRQLTEKIQEITGIRLLAEVP